MNWSTEQTAIFDHFANESGNLVVEARAGTGKTTTIKEAFNRAPESRMLYVVFNKKNQKEAESKIKNSRVEVRTLHSLGFMYLKGLWPRCKPDFDGLEFDRLDSVIDLRNRMEVRASIVKLIGLAKNCLLSPTVELLKDLAAKNDIGFWETNINPYEIVLRVLELSKQKDPEGRISFDDMVWLPVVLDVVKPRYGLVCVDEAQDMNAPQLAMARRACSSGGRVIVVGDSRQAIYGFRGAVQDGINMMRITLRAKTLALTTTYRCPKKVVEVARSIVPDYHAADTAPDGEVTNINETKALDMARPGDAILSRLNAPLMPMALGFIRRRISARIEGRDIGKQIIGMIDSLKARDVKHFIERVNEWEAKQVDRLSGSKYAEKRIEQVRDMAQTLLALAQDAESVPEIRSAVDKLFQDTNENSKPAVILSSVHKAKGLEWPRVFVLSETFRRGKGTEEDNIYYVAVTRSMSELYLVHGKTAQEAPKPSEGKEAKPVETAATPGPTLESKPLSEASDLREPPVPGPERLDGSSIPAGARFFTRGDVMTHAKAEWVCLRVGNCNAKFACLSAPAYDEVEFTQTKIDDKSGDLVEVKVKRKLKRDSRELAFSNNYFPTDPSSRPIRRLTEDQIMEFLKGGTRAVEKQLPGETERNTDSMAKKTKATKGNNHKSGAADLMRELYDKGVSKAEAFKKVIAAFPVMENDEKKYGGLTSRWKTAERIAKNAKAGAKATTTKKATAKKSTPPPRKGKSKPPARASTPPPRQPAAAVAASPAPPASAPAPVAAAAPAATEPPAE